MKDVINNDDDNPQDDVAKSLKTNLDGEDVSEETNTKEVVEDVEKESLEEYAYIQMEALMKKKYKRMLIT